MEATAALPHGNLNRLAVNATTQLLRERKFKARLVDQADPRSGQRVLDVGCGTGTLALSLKARAPETEVIGLDADPEILDRARANAREAELDVRFDRALATELPFEDGSFDMVVSTLFFHHLTSADKRRTAKEIARVLKSGGGLHVADMGGPADPLMRGLFFFTVRLFDGLEQTRDKRCRRPAGDIRSWWPGSGHRNRPLPYRAGIVGLYRARKGNGGE
jgi:ubiquinone/menaquinone biosynthesis C-methylase UbiE